MSSELFFEIFRTGAADGIAGALNRLDGQGWRRLIDTALLHKCGPLLRERLKRWNLLDLAPEEVRSELSAITRANALRNLRRFAQLKELMSGLEGRAPLILPKGGRLARTHYPDLSLRSMSDLDVLVRPEHFARVEAQLAGLGFKRMLPAPFESDGHAEHEVEFQRQDLVYDVHRSFLDMPAPFTIDDEGLWARAVPAEHAGLFYLSLEDELAYVCLHAAYHHGLAVGFYAFIDIALLCRDPGLDWRQFLDRVRAWRAGRSIFLALRLAECMAGATVPRDVLEALRPSGFDETMLTAAVRIVRESQEGRSGSSLQFARILARFGQLDRWRQLPATLRRRFLVHPDQRSRWSPQAGTDWLSQIRPLFANAAQLVYDRSQRRIFLNHVRSRRLRRWMESPR